MSDKNEMKMMDGNEAAARVAHRLNEVSIIYPITPSSPMGEWADAWSAEGITNIWGKTPNVLEMQSEAGAIGAVHGSLQAGSLTSTFTASQGLLLMIPNMYKIAGELLPFVMHVAARTVATHALSIFGDHSDVMACRQTGFGMLASNSVQEAQDMAAIAQISTLTSRVPFLHFFDGFRTSHEINKIELISDNQLKELMEGVPSDILSENAMTPDRPVVRGTAQNPDVFFQIREASNPYYESCPSKVEEAMRKFEKVVGRSYHLIDYVGAEDAENVIVMMGSGAETAEKTAKYLNETGGKTGVMKVHLYRPFPVDAFIKALPKTVKTVCVLDRTKESGSIGEPLYLDTVAALAEGVVRKEIASMPSVLGGRYGLSSKEFTPAMAKGVFENTTKNHFTIGINDDLTNHSLPYDKTFDIKEDGVTQCLFFGLGADGTVGANKNSIKIIASEGDFYGQAYFVYDSKKSGAMTTSHLRFSKKPINAPYLVQKASFIACHHTPFLSKIDMLSAATDGAVFLINSHEPQDKVWDSLPYEVQEQIIEKHMKFYAIDAVEVARKTGMGRRINTIMQTCFFAISGVLPKEEAIEKIKKSIKKTYARKGDAIVQSNIAAVEAALDHLYEVKVSEKPTSTHHMLPGVPSYAPKIVQDVTGKIIEGKGEDLPVSAFDWTADGTWPTATTQYEKRCIATEVPAWNSDLCIQCGKCAMACPHAAIRLKVADKEDLKDAPDSFKTTPYKGKDFEGKEFVVQISSQDCTGCSLCSQVCPGKSRTEPDKKALTMTPVEVNFDKNVENWKFFKKLPDVDRTKVDTKLVKNAQLLRPLFEFSGACAGCGETPYVKLMTQLFGDRLVVANATGCSSIYGGNLPTTPYAKDENGRGPTWANSLFEDNAEFGLGMRYSIDSKKEFAAQLLQELSSEVGDELTSAIFAADQSTEAGIAEQRERVEALKTKLASINSPKAKKLTLLADYLVEKSVWILGGDGWAYDIGYGGLDHVLYSGRNVNILVMDTGVYSNTGGQRSKATPVGASAKFAVAGSDLPRKDLGMIAMSSENIYVAQVSMGAKDAQVLKAFKEAESFNGPSLIIAYAHCIAHGYDIGKDGMEHQKLAVNSGLWPLYRFDPRRIQEGKNPLQLDSKATISVEEFMATETRFKVVKKQNPERYTELVNLAQDQIEKRVKLYNQLAKDED
ncbi:MAG: pyruvate:ferredoxin (flavodoxin) oxidoreductase [Alphaproteobacteria bacterium]|nr:pyruvate:ferredoxin (flavodoxin) oxidoreductase [Alphaproteobacteria bacterium]